MTDVSGKAAGRGGDVEPDKSGLDTPGMGSSGPERLGLDKIGPGSRSPVELPIAELLSAVETELIPRLLVSHTQDLPAGDSINPERYDTPPPSGDWASQARIDEFANWCITGGGEERMGEHVSTLLSRGVRLDAIYLHLLAPAARELGERWSTDEVSFIDVQLGLSRMHQLVCECSRIGMRESSRPQGRSILLAAAPGDQHTFGVMMAADFYERHGWQVSNLSGLGHEFVLNRVSSCRYSAVGFSLHNESGFEELHLLLEQVRRRSANPDVVLLVGGDFFVRHPKMGDAVGADIVADNAFHAVHETEALLEQLSQRANAVPA